MKYLVIMVIAFAAYAAADGDWKPVGDKATFVKYHEDCRKESGATEEQAQKILRGEYPDEKEVHDYIYCADKKIGIFTDDKGYDLERTAKQVEAILGNIEKLGETLANCFDSNKQGSSPAEWAYRGKVCVMKTKIGEMIKKSGKTHLS